MTDLKFYRVWAVTLRYLHQSTRDILMLADLVFWPLTDIVVWGMMSLWLEKAGSGVPNIVVLLVSGLVLWQIVYQANMDITNNLIEEFWSQNLGNIFGSPLTVNEWISAVMLLGSFRIVLIVCFGSIVSWLLYAFNVFSMGLILIPFGISLLLTGWAIGFCTAAFIMYGGMRVHWATWALGTIMSPFIAIYYPVETLPSWGQVISHCMPPMYVFEGMRKIIFHGIIPYDYLMISFALNALYLTLSILFFKYMFEKSRARGLSRIE